MSYYIGMDVGGTYARMKIVDHAGKTLLQTEGQGGTIPVAGYLEMERRLRQLILPALNTCGFTAGQCSGLCIGASGIDAPELRQQYIKILVDMGFQRSRVQAYNDCEMLLSLYDGPCVALISGTGSIATGRLSPEGKIERCGGWSYVISDEGSAISLGFSAMRAVLKHWDGQEESPALAALFEEQPEVDNPHKLVTWCHQNIMQKDKLARFAPFVDKAAQAGDTVAQKLLRQAAEELAMLVSTVAQKLHMQSQHFSIVLWGSVIMQNESMQQSLCQRLKQLCPMGKIELLHSTGLDCAVQLARKDHNAQVVDSYVG